MESPTVIMAIRVCICSRPATTTQPWAWTSRCWKPRARSPWSATPPSTAMASPGSTISRPSRPGPTPPAITGVEGAAVPARHSWRKIISGVLQAGGELRHLFHPAIQTRRGRDPARGRYRRDLWRGQGGRAGRTSCPRQWAPVTRAGDAAKGRSSTVAIPKRKGRRCPAQCARWR